jgi:hypothetical protein
MHAGALFIPCWKIIYCEREVGPKTFREKEYKPNYATGLSLFLAAFALLGCLELYISF